MPTVSEVAPTLCSVASEEEVRAACCDPKPAAPAPMPAPIQPKRYRQAMLILQEHPEYTNAQVANLVSSMRPEVVATIRAEMAAVKAEPGIKTSAELAASEPLEDPKEVVIK